IAALSESEQVWKQIEPFFQPAAGFENEFGTYKSPLKFHDGRAVEKPADWPRRRREILDYWHKVMGPWPALIEKPAIEYLAKERRDNFMQHRVRVEIARGQTVEGWLL